MGDQENEALKRAFTKFATFGNRSTSVVQVLMDSRACQKLCKDAGLTGKKLSMTDIDLLFASTKNKGERKIGFTQFLRVVNGIAIKVGRSHAEIVQMIVHSEPTLNVSATTMNVAAMSLASSPAPATQAAKAPATPQPKPTTTPQCTPNASLASPTIMPRLHPDWYEVKNPNDSSEEAPFYYVNRLTGETSWDPPVLVPTDAVQPPPPPPPMNTATTPVKDAVPVATPTDAEVTIGTSEQKDDENATTPLAAGDKTGASEPGDPNPDIQGKVLAEKNDNAVKTPKTPKLVVNPNPETPVREKRPSIFDKLTDPKLYTGAHKHRFDLETGKGKGLEGRDKMAKGAGATASTPKSSFKGNTNTGTDETVHSISQVLRGR